MRIFVSSIYIGNENNHRIGRTSQRRAHVHRSSFFSDDIVSALYAYGKNKYICITIEPNILKQVHIATPLLLRKSPFEFVTWTPCIDLTQSFSLIENKFSKTVRNENRYAEKNGAAVLHGDSETLFQDFLSIMQNTQTRKNFRGHTTNYYTHVFEALKKYAQVEIFIVYEKNAPIGGACVFVFKDTLYYVYAGSLGQKILRGSMYHLVISIIQWGQSCGKKNLDLFGSLAPDDVSQHPWQGFTKFKKSFGPVFNEYVGAYDIVLNKPIYFLYSTFYRIKRILIKK